MEIKTKTYVASVAGAVVLFFFSGVCAGLSLGIDYLLDACHPSLYLNSAFGLKYYVDFPPHFFAGAAIALTFMGVDMFFSGAVGPSGYLYRWAVATAFIIGVIWEGYEMVKGYDLVQFSADAGGMTYVHLDQAKDLLVDCLGAAASVKVVTWLIAEADSFLGHCMKAGSLGD